MDDTTHSAVEALEWFEKLCDQPRDVVDRALEGLGDPLRERVQAMLQWDRSQEPLDLSRLQWALAGEIASDLQPRAPRELPDRFGPYRIVGPLGAGGMGAVFVAEQDSPQRRVALKILHATGEHAQADALREAQALADVRGTHIPHVIEVGVQDGIAWLAMELVQGSPLRTWCTARSTTERVTVLAHIARGVAAAHRTGIVHRDLKPENVIVQDDGMPRILDFGLAGETRQEDVGGTLPYLAPERLEGEPASAASDVFALGVTAFEVLTGRRPYPEAAVPSLSSERRARMDAVVTWPSEQGIGDRALDAVVGMAIAPACDRYLAADALADDLEAWLDHRPVKACPAGWLTGTRLWARRRRRELIWAGAAVASLAALVLAVAGGVGAQERWTRREQEREALERLQILEASLEESYADGEIGRATRVLQRFVSEVGVRRTRAAGQVWMRHFERVLASGDIPAARRALARAYLTVDVEDRPAVRRAMAEVQAQQCAWVPLLEVLGDDDSAWARGLRTRALIALRQFEDPRIDSEAIDEDLLANLRQAHRTDFRPIWVRPEGENLWIAEQDRHRLAVTRSTVELPAVASLPLPPHVRFGFEHPLKVAGAPLLAGYSTVEPDHVRLWSTEDEHFVLEGIVGDISSYLGAAAMADTDGNGVSELYLGSLSPERVLIRADQRASGWTHGDALPGGPSLEVDIEDLVAADLDDDGDDELLVSTGLWGGHDLRVYDRRQEGLVLVQRVRFEGIPRVQVLRAPGGTRLLVMATTFEGLDRPGSDRYPSGLHSFEVTGSGLVHDGFLSIPGIQAGHGDLFVGDFTGDDEVEVAVHIHGTPEHTWIVELRDGRPLDGTLLSGAKPMGTVDLDGDGDDELLLRLSDDDFHLWVVGAGGGSLPPREQPPAAARPGSNEAVHDLLRFGFELETADALQALAPTSAAEHQEAIATAATLHARAGRFEDAVELFEAMDTTRGSSTWSSQHQASVAAAHLDRPPTWVGVGRALADAATLRRPEVLRSRDEGLVIDGISLDGLLLEVPFEASGPSLGLEVRWAVDTMEPGAHLIVELVHPDETVALQIEQAAWGGSLNSDRWVQCQDGTVSRLTEAYGTLSPDLETTTHDVRLHRNGVETRCWIRRNGRTQVTDTQPNTAVDEGPLRLRVRLEAPQDLLTTRVRATLERVAVWGAQPLEGDRRAWRHAWVDGRLSSAMDGVDDDWARLQLAMELGAWKQAADLLDALVLDSPEGRQLLQRGLRLDPVAWIPLVRDHAPESFPELYARAWVPAVASQRTPEVLASVHHPFIDELEPDTPAVRDLLFQRARLLASEGFHDRARRLGERLLPHVDGIRAVNLQLLLATLRAEAGDLEGARRYCTAAAAHDRWYILENAILDDSRVREACEGRSP